MICSLALGQIIHMKFVLLLFAGLFFCFAGNIYAQKPVNWTSAQVMQPALLAGMINQNKPLPVLISIGPGAPIKQSINIGSVKESNNMDAFKTTLSHLPKDTTIVVYCGCCPYEHCPNVRPAIDVLKTMGFTHYKLLDLPTNIKTDWIDKGYPVE